MNTSPVENQEETSALQSASEHLVELAQSKQLVLLGDQTGIAEHVRFISQILPDLYEAGVHNLAWEFTNSRTQESLDQLLTAESWDEAACTNLFIDLLGIGFTYFEYAEVLKSAWSLNRGLESQAPRFRVVGLGLPTYVEDPSLLEGRSAAELELRNWWMGGNYRDVAAFHMANTLTNEVLRSGGRAVVLMSGERTTTGLIQWEDGLPTVTVGNLLHRWMAEGVARVLFHGSVADSQATERVEALIAAAPEKPDTFGIALDLATLGNVGLNEVVGSVDGKETSLRLKDVADSYIWLSNIESWSPCQLIENVITEENFEYLEARYRAIDPRSEPWTQSELEQIRIDGQTKLSDSWLKLPIIEEPPAKRNKFRKRRT